MSDFTAESLSKALKKKLPHGFTAVGIDIDLAARQWLLTIEGDQVLSPVEQTKLEKQLNSFDIDFQIELKHIIRKGVHPEEIIANPESSINQDASEAPPWHEEADASVVVPIADALDPDIDLWPDMHPNINISGQSEVVDMPIDLDTQTFPLNDLFGEMDQASKDRDALALREQQALREIMVVHSSGNEKTVYYGRKIKNDPVSMATIETGSSTGRVTVRGRVFATEHFVSRYGGADSYRFDLTDETDSITVKVLGRYDRRSQNGDQSPSDNGMGKLSLIKKGQWLLVSGKLNEDSKDGELQIIADSIVEDEAPPIRDDRGLAGRKRVELHAHTQMSSMDAICSATDLVALAAHYGHEAIAITDHGVLQAYPEAMRAGKKHGIKIIYGCEGYLIDNSEDKRYAHISILVKNSKGLKDLYRLTTTAHLEYFYRRPRLMRSLLAASREDLLLGSACAAGEVYQALIEGMALDFVVAKEKAAKAAEFYDYLEIMPLNHLSFLIEAGKVETEDDLREINKAIIAIAEAQNKPVVATSDVHFLQPEDAIYREILQAGQDYDLGDGQCLLHLRTTDEMLDEFSYLGSELAERVVIDNTQSIAAMISDVKPIPDQLYPPKIEGSDTKLKELVWDTARQRYGENLPVIVQERVTRELNSIIGFGFAVTYWIAHELVKRSNLDGYLVGSRGSVGSSLAAHFAGITEVNPLPSHYLCPNCCHSDFSQGERYDCGADMPETNCPECHTPMIRDGFNIAFETFMGFEGEKVPDIDLNFSGEYHSEAHRQCELLLGKENVFRAGTISTIADKTAFGFVIKYFEGRGETRRKAEISRLAQGLIGIKRTTGQHPGGLMVVPNDMDIHDFTPAQRPADDRKTETITTHFDFVAIHDCLLKLDLLGHDDPTILRHLQDITGVDVRTVPLDDPQVLSLFTSVEALKSSGELQTKVGTLGVPEFGTNFVRGMLLDAKPSLFSDLVRISGFSHGTDVWANNARDLIVNGIAKLNEAISTRDDIMIYLIGKKLADRDAFRITEAVRKGRGLSPEDEKLMREHDVPDWYITSCKKIQYLFPKAHAVAYVTSGFRIAWFKVYHPKAFYATYFSIRGLDGFDAGLATQGIRAMQTVYNELLVKNKANNASAKEQSQIGHLELALEASARGIVFLPVDLYKSDATRYLVRPEGLLPPLCGLQGVGVNAAQSLVVARATGGEFTSIEDIRLRSRVNKSVIDALLNAGCLEGLNETDQLTLF